MSDRTGIEWTEATWNPLRGCSRVSEGCRHCYAEGIAARFSGAGQPYEGLARIVTRHDRKSEARWTGKVVLAPKNVLQQPLRWGRPRLIFVNSMSDLFHEAVPDDWIDQVFAVMAAATCHTFQILTKRPERMRAYISSPATVDRVLMRARELDPTLWYLDWPMPNVWLGTSIEDQPTAETRLPYLCRTPAAVRFVSAEPLLGQVDLFAALGGGSGIHQVIVGGESGPAARPMHPAWARLLRDQCNAAGIAFFFKQWGEWLPTGGVDAYIFGPKRQRQYPASEGVSMLSDGRVCLMDFSVADHAQRIRDGKAFNSRAVEVDERALADFAASVRDPSRELDNPLGYQWLYRVGKRKAGRLLDGVLHDAMPAPLNPQSAPHERIWA
ncbi:DUF5131 family protein [Devosia sp. D6-9]|nr:DUF5131 family protein [Devosia sp. D6-9]